MAKYTNTQIIISASTLNVVYRSKRISHSQLRQQQKKRRQKITSCDRTGRTIVRNKSSKMLGLHSDCIINDQCYALPVSQLSWQSNVRMLNSYQKIFKSLRCIYAPPPISVVIFYMAIACSIMYLCYGKMTLDFVTASAHRLSSQRNCITTKMYFLNSSSAWMYVCFVFCVGDIFMIFGFVHSL